MITDEPTVDWVAAERAWAKARTALDEGDLVRARSSAAEALGFEVDPEAPIDDARLAQDTTSDLMHNALRRLGLGRAEELAYRVGLKPVLYLTPRAAERSVLRSRYEGHHVEEVHTGAGGRVHLFVSRDRDRARLAADVYRHGDPSAEIAVMGELMGYPRCCTEAFATLADRSNDSNNLWTVASRRCDRPNPLLNLAVAFLVPFFPCRLDCPEAVAFADEVLSALLPDPADRRRVRSGMARPTVFFDRDHILVLDGVAIAGGARFSGAALINRSRHPRLDERLVNLVLGSAFSAAAELRLGADEWRFVGPRGESQMQRRPEAPGVLIPFAQDRHRGTAS